MVEINEIKTCSNDGCSNEASGRYCSPKCQEEHESAAEEPPPATAASVAASSSTPAGQTTSSAAPTMLPIPTTEQKSAPTAMQSMCRQLGEIAARELVESIAGGGIVKLSKSTENVFGIEAPRNDAGNGEERAKGGNRKDAVTKPSKAVRDLPTGQLIFFVYSEIYHQRLYYAVRESAEAYAQAPRKFEAELVRNVTAATLPEAFVEWAGRLLDDEAYFRKGHCLEMKRRGLLGKDETVVNPESEAHWEMMARFRTYPAPS